MFSGNPFRLVVHSISRQHFELVLYELEVGVFVSLFLMFLFLSFVYFRVLGFKLGPYDLSQFRSKKARQKLSPYGVAPDRYHSSSFFRHGPESFTSGPSTGVGHYWIKRVEPLFDLYLRQIGILTLDENSRKIQRRFSTIFIFKGS